MDIQISLDDAEFEREIGALVRRLQQPRKLMAGISAELLSITEEAFDAEGPGWQALASSTISQRTKAGTWPGKKLQVSTAGLASTLAQQHTNASATISAGAGKSAAYAAAHQFGAKTGRNRSTILPARPYMPITKTGNSFTLTPSAKKAISDMAINFVVNGNV